MDKNKKADQIVLETTIFIVLNIFFFVIIMIFVWRSAQGAVIYEQIYAKQVALTLDNAKPGMTFFIDMKKGIEIAEDKYHRKREDIVKINQDKNIVIVALTNTGAYSFEYFSDYDFSTEFSGDYLIIEVKEKKNA
jgi:hypothetical protein